MLWMAGMAEWNNEDSVWIPKILENFVLSTQARGKPQELSYCPSFIRCCDKSQVREEKFHFSSQFQVTIYLSRDIQVTGS